LLKLNVIQAEYGDCLLIESSDGKNSNFILVDGGPSQTYKRHLDPALKLIVTSKKLDLVILSHIDNDHVLGLLDLLEAIMKEREGNSTELMNIEGLWHNSFNDLLGTKEESNKLAQNPSMSNLFLLNKGGDFINKLPALGALKGISEGRDITKLAKQLHVPINAQFGGNPLVVSGEEYKIIELGNMKLHILGPTQKNLDRLKKMWDEWERQHLQAKVTIDDYAALEALDSSITNLSSIMFLVESAGKKMLFTGDGLGSDVVESLSKTGLLDSQGRLHVDILKVPHHGSGRNASKQFFDTVTADLYIISANGRDDNPSFSTLKWIIESGKKYHRKVTIIAESSFSSTASAASSRKFSAGPVVSGSDSAAPTRFWFFCALSKFSVESLINIL
jgi:beta-lactamase superfamily II metal-dependent hydrolase